ncbi:MAG: ammonium transporter [Planctomycetota bacterium]
MAIALRQSGLLALMLAGLLTMFGPPTTAWAQEDGESTTEETTTEETTADDGGDEAEAEEEAWDGGPNYAINNALMFLCAVLVFFMQAGFAMVEAGFNSAKNAVNILFKNSMDICVGVLLFFTVGFGLMYPTFYEPPKVGEEEGSWDDVSGYFAFGGVGLDGYKAADGRSVSPEVDFLFQAVFAATAATIVSGAVAGRMKVSGYLVYSAILTAVIYPISGYWKWGGGWLMQFGEKLEDGSYPMAFQDFAGSAVVHGVGGFAALAGAIILGPRLGRYVDGKSVPMPGHSLPLAALGVFILWFGWFGFNPGSMLVYSSTGDSDGMIHCALTTILAAAAGGLVSTLLSWVMFGKPDLSMGLNGILGGLVGITACCDCMSTWMAIVVGAVAGLLIILGVLMLDKLKIDDPVGAWPVHGLCGIWGCLAIGILPNTHLEAGSTTFAIQAIGTGAICAWAFATMLALFAVLKAIGILRVSPEEEQAGLDVSEHGMQAYG